MSREHTLREASRAKTFANTRGKRFVNAAFLASLANNSLDRAREG